MPIPRNRTRPGTRKRGAASDAASPTASSAPAMSMSRPTSTYPPFTGGLRNVTTRARTAQAPWAWATRKGPRTVCVRGIRCSGGAGAAEIAHAGASVGRGIGAEVRQQRRVHEIRQQALELAVPAVHKAPVDRLVDTADEHLGGDG